PEIQDPAVLRHFPRNREQHNYPPKENCSSSMMIPNRVADSNRPSAAGQNFKAKVSYAAGAAVGWHELARP
ncbi:MAG TPA: hypothetical protein PLM02_12635, partial [Azonexus sp.]|nr:hypothetical protein [Azonexus sp.]